MTNNEQSEKQTALDAIGELLDGHFHEAVESADDDGAFSLSFRVRFSRSHVPTRVKVTCRVSKVTTDEIETSADDPEQAKLPL